MTAPSYVPLRPTTRLLVGTLVRAYRPIVRRAARAALQGRRCDPTQPRAGRFLRADVDAILADIWRRVPRLLREDDLDRIPTIGNRHNVFLGALTVAAYHALLERGVEPHYAMELFADVGWKIYERMLAVAFALARLATRDPQRRMERTLGALMRFPFSAPGEPGYEVRAWSEPGRLHTHWTHCAPLGFVRRHVQRHGDHGELEAFYRSWCLYDWPGADVLAGGRAGEHGHYARPHTLSLGDAVCDMCWSASPAGPDPSERAGGGRTGGPARGATTPWANAPRPALEVTQRAVAQGGRGRQPGDGLAQQ